MELDILEKIKEHLCELATLSLTIALEEKNKSEL